MVENIFQQKRWKIFSTKNDGKYFPVENVFRKADEFSLNFGIFHQFLNASFRVSKTRQIGPFFGIFH